MREWYRRKLRELAGIPLTPPRTGRAEPAATAGARTRRRRPASIPTGRSILSLTGPGRPRRPASSASCCATLELVDADTLTALLVEARRQRRSLRQVLLASGVVTLYQLALIEAGNLDGLMLGPVRVIDRLRATPHETVYRVFDPRRGTEAVLRHLAEAEMHDAVRPDEFRQRFAPGDAQRPAPGGTLEVLEIDGRPAALQEWLTGLPRDRLAAAGRGPGRVVSPADAGRAGPARRPPGRPGPRPPQRRRCCC